MSDMDPVSISVTVAAVVVGLFVQYFVIRWAVLSALKAHSQYEREFSRRVRGEATPPN